MYVPAKQQNPNQQIPVIMDFGTLNTRVGYVGHDCPRAIIPSDYAKIDTDHANLEWFSLNLPEQAEHQQFIKNGQIQDWDIIGKYMDNIMGNILLTEPKDVPLFLVEPPLQQRENRIKMVEVAFEECGFNSIYMHKGPILSSYIFAKETMLLVDSGADGTYVIPIQEGYINQKALMRTEIGGEFLTKALYDIICKKQTKQPITGYAKNYKNLTPSLQKWASLELTREIKHQQCKLFELNMDKSLVFNEAVDTAIFELPDGNKLEVGKEQYGVPELMYRDIPEHNFTGLQNLVRQVIEKVDYDLRKELIQNIMIVGGNSMTFQFDQRLNKEITECDIFGFQNRCKTQSSPNQQERLYSAWLGASIVGSMNTFEQMLMTKKDYEEHGSILIERKILV